MKKFISLALALGVAACAASGGLTPQASQTVSVICADDATAYAAGQAVGVAIPVPQVQAGLAADALLVHPAVIAACAAAGMVPVAPAPAAPVAAPAPAPAAPVAAPAAAPAAK